MSIRIIALDNDRSAPVVFCDHCKQQIRRAEDGNVEWRGLDIAEAHFTHKDCSNAFRLANPHIRFSMELITFPLRLANNLEIDPDRAQEIVNGLAGLE
jgi:hypothetical protein